MEPPPPPPPPPPFPAVNAPAPLRPEPPANSLGPLLKKVLAPVFFVLVLFAKWFAKVKFIFIPLLKFFPVLLKTGGTMALSIGAYALFYGWKFGVGLVALIFVHECGHLVAARRLGLNVGAPVFIPFMGAVIALKEAPKNAWIEAQVALGGPLLGSVGALLCYGVFLITSDRLWLVLANTGFFLNLFNLTPIGFLDGGRIVKALSPWLWVGGLVILAIMVATHLNPILLLILICSVPQLISLFRKKTDEEKRFYEVTPSQRVIVALLYFGLAAALVVGVKFTFLPNLPTN